VEVQSEDVTKSDSSETNRLRPPLKSVSVVAEYAGGGGGYGIGVVLLLSH